MPSLTAAVLARDNAAEIGPCLASVAWADELLVILDDRSTDETEQIARQLGARVVRNRFHDFAQQRNFGLGLVHTEWLFYIDSDELATPELGQEIRKAIGQPGYVGWWIPRRNFIWGHETRHGGWYPDYQLRLLRIGRARYDPERQVHEVVLLDGEAGYLQQPLIHHNYRTFHQFVTKQRQYVPLEARILFDRGVRPKPWTVLSQPCREFWRRYIRLQGYRDGFHGFILCALTAYYYGFCVSRALQRLWRETAP